MKMSFSVGNDNGNSEHDLIIDGILITQPNVFSKVSKMPDLSSLDDDAFVDNILSNIITTVMTPSINSGAAGSYFVGEYATKSGKLLHNIEVGAFNSKINSDVPIINSLSVISAYAVQQAYKEDKAIEEIELSIDMVTALPVTQHTPVSAKQFFNRFMDDNHEVKVHLPSKIVTVKIHFNYVKVLPESICATFYVQALTKENADAITSKAAKDEYMNIVDRFFKDFNEKYGMDIDGNYFKGLKILHNSIGEGTTEIPLTNDISFDPNFIAGSNNGVGHAINEVLSEFIRNKNLVKFSRQDYSAILRDDNHKHFSFAKDLVNESLEEQGEIIFRNTKHEVGRANNDIDIIMVHGGGSILMKDYLLDKYYDFGDKTEVKVFYVNEEFAVVLEVLGMYAFLKSPIYKNLKQAYQKKEKTSTVAASL